MSYVDCNPVRITSLEADNEAAIAFVKTLREAVKALNNRMSDIFNHVIHGIRSINIQELLRKFNDALNFNCEYIPERRQVRCYKNRYVWISG